MGTTFYELSSHDKDLLSYYNVLITCHILFFNQSGLFQQGQSDWLIYGEICLIVIFILYQCTFLIQ